MAYNPAMYQTYGNMYSGNAYGQAYVPAPQPMQQSMAAPPVSAQGNPVGILWVDGEIGAKAYQMPAGWPVNTPLPLWDTNDTIIYLKSTNQMGMPNPIQKIYYKMEELTPKHTGQDIGLLGSGETEKDPHPDMTQYVRKDELERMKDEIVRSIQENVASGTAGAGGAARKNAKGDV